MAKKKAKEKPKKIFLSHSSEDVFEAELLQFAYETLMNDFGVKIWAYGRDQKKSERDVAGSVKKHVKESKAFIFLLTPSTLDRLTEVSNTKKVTQWTELSYADAYDIPTVVLLHRLTDAELKSYGEKINPFVQMGVSSKAIEWRVVGSELSEIIGAENG